MLAVLKEITKHYRIEYRWHRRWYRTRKMIAKYASTNAEDIVEVQPMTKDAGEIFTMKTRYEGKQE